MTNAADMLATGFATLPDLIRAHALERGDRTAVADARGSIDYRTLDAMMDRIAAALQRDGVAPGTAVAIVAAPTTEYAAAFLGSVRAGCVATPIAPSATPAAIAAMIADSGAPIVFLDAENARALEGQMLAARPVLFSRESGSPAWATASAGEQSFDAWLAPPEIKPTPVDIAPEDPFNIIYSSGTTGTPKGIVQSHAMRWAHISRNTAAGFDTAVTMIATPLYSNTTLVSFLPTLGWGGTVVLMGKFDARAYLELAQHYHATHTMLVPVQYQRIMALPDFDAFDLSAFRFKTSTSAPFSATLKADVVARWPGVLVEFYGMTEGGASCALNATANPTKLHTVGQPMPGHEIRLIDDDGIEVAPGEMGEVVGRSPAMMNGYHGRTEATRDAEWHDADGNRYIRHGDVGRFDEDGFLTLMDRKKDLIISGGFNIYPSDLEAVLAQHPAVADCAVIGVPSEAWGETPVGFYVPRDGATEDASSILSWVNAQVGKTQRLSALHVTDELPRSAIGKVLKRDLRDQLAASLPSS
ncbi:acyl-CoA synthetase (AMP-forming)/AMP-acid ligase II [Sphingomonas sp. PP-F2F-G114-C0414]|uniref:class I adenylate-forming enzyme family protein n=1 Tax=Sphingomonas sp. PP-F2F-G114-C0414 TaxID=2135662 RepID=UPI000EF948D4|nr:class I adenylate-forming enzyme family protein [Sphingomonas sp. PP-F2F-G114-C0414]RMB37278.1 acyl-CoA synthetase (AMP-forming)/AMP-acid ligase II [Sphingomonas sp. PP-F2F-G114-C0414]